ncbi:MAG: chorismate mutase [Vicinamibacterales bacterium]
MTIEELRGRVDVIDDQIVALLNARAACAIEIGRLKRASGIPVFQQVREREVVERARALTSRLGGPLSEDAIGRLFERIIDEARRLEQDCLEQD